MDVRQIVHDLRQVGGAWYILFTLPSLAGMSRPVIDPTLTLQPGAADGEDSPLCNAFGGARNNGISNAGLVYNKATFLLRFNVSSIPVSALCTSATLTMTLTAKDVGTPQACNIYSVGVANTTWIEGTKNGTTADAGEPCWIAKQGDGAGGVLVAWAGSAGCKTSGTDYEAAALGNITVGATDVAGTAYNTLLTAARIQGWFGAVNTNHGLAILNNDAGVSVSFATSDHATASYRPKLVVVYTLPGGNYPLDSAFVSAFRGPMS